MDLRWESVRWIGEGKLNQGGFQIWSPCERDSVITLCGVTRAEEVVGVFKILFNPQQLIYARYTSNIFIARVILTCNKSHFSKLFIAKLNFDSSQIRIQLLSGVWTQSFMLAALNAVKVVRSGSCWRKLFIFARSAVIYFLILELIQTAFGLSLINVIYVIVLPLSSDLLLVGVS